MIVNVKIKAALKRTDREGVHGIISSEDYVWFVQTLDVWLPHIGVKLGLPGVICGIIDGVDEIVGVANLEHQVVVNVSVPGSSGGPWRVWHKDILNLLDHGWNFDSFQSFTNNKDDMEATKRLRRRCNEIRTEPFSSE